MSNAQIDILNDLTKTMIDSYKGYQTCIETADDSYALQSQFVQRAAQRSQLISEFQNEVRTLGGEPETEGSLSGTAHRAWTKFTTLFQDDEKAAIEAIDDGEEYLADKIRKNLQTTDINPRTQDMLKRAYSSASEGERFADMLS